MKMGRSSFRVNSLLARLQRETREGERKRERESSTSAKAETKGGGNNLSLSSSALYFMGFYKPAGKKKNSRVQGYEVTPGN